MFAYYWELTVIIEFMLLVSINTKEYNFDQNICYEINSNAFKWRTDNTRDSNCEVTSRNQRQTNLANRNSFSRNYPHRIHIENDQKIRQKAIEGNRQYFARTRVVTTKQNDQTHRISRQNEKFEHINRNRSFERMNYGTMRKIENFENIDIRHFSNKNNRLQSESNQNNNERIRYDDRIQKLAKQAYAKRIVGSTNNYMIQSTRRQHRLSDRSEAKRRVIRNVYFGRLERITDLIRLNGHPIRIHSSLYKPFNRNTLILPDKIVQELQDNNTTIENNEMAFNIDLTHRMPTVQFNHYIKKPYNQIHDMYHTRIRIYTPKVHYDLKSIKTGQLQHTNLNEDILTHTGNNVTSKTELLLQNSGCNDVFEGNIKTVVNMQRTRLYRWKNQHSNMKNERRLSINDPRTSQTPIKDAHKIPFIKFCTELLNDYYIGLIQTVLLSLIVVLTTKGTDKLKFHILQQLKHFVSIWNI